MNQTELEKALKQAQDAYYKGEPIMSDVEFDRLWDELEERFPDSILLREVGADHTDGFAKVKHFIIMGSQAKANTAEDMNTFFSKNGKGKYLAQYKLDGASISLNYENGKFVNSATRGDGCLSEETIIETDKGNLTIKELVENKIQCKVKGYNKETKEIIWTPIINWYINKNKEKWYELKLENGKSIRLTGNHKVFCKNLNDYKMVKDLTENDDILIF